MGNYAKWGNNQTAALIRIIRKILEGEKMIQGRAARGADVRILFERNRRCYGQH